MPQPAKTTDSQPDYDVALQFINGYVDCCNQTSDAKEQLKWIQNQSLLSRNFKSEFARIVDEAWKEDPEYGLGFDPVFDAQDYPEKGFEIDSIDQDYVIVKGKEWSEFRLTIKLTKQDDQWLVDGAGIIQIPKEKRIRR